MNKPLEGQTILVTRSVEDYKKTASMIEQLGGEPIGCPMVEYSIVGEEFSELDASIAKLDQYDWIMFTSKNGFLFLKRRMEEIGIDLSVFRQTRCAVIGRTTKSVVEADGIHVDFVSSVSEAESFFEEFRQVFPIQDQQFLIPTSQIAHDILPKLIKEYGGHVEQVVAYLTERKNQFPFYVNDLLVENKVIWVMLTSSSIAEAFIHRMQQFEGCKSKLLFASIGSSTSATLRTYQIEPTVEASEHNIDGLLQAITNYVNREN